MRTEFLASIISLNSLILEVFALHSQKLWPRKASAPSSGQSGSGCLENIKVLEGSWFRSLRAKGPRSMYFAIFSWKLWFCLCCVLLPRRPSPPCPHAGTPFYLLVQAGLAHVKGPQVKLS